MKKFIIFIFVLIGLSNAVSANNGIPISPDAQNIYCGTYEVTLNLGLIEIKTSVTVCCWRAHLPPAGYDCSFEIVDAPKNGGKVSVQQFLDALCQQHNIGCETITAVEIAESTTATLTDEGGSQMGRYKIKSKTYPINKSVEGYSIPVELIEVRN